MGQGRPTGTSLGAAQGSITINTSQLQQAQAHVVAAAAQMTRAMNSINASTNQAQGSLTALASSFRGVAGAFGVTLGVQTVMQLGKAAIAAGALATAYDRQGIAAANLAGSQGNLNKLMEVYDRATGGIVSQAAALQNVTKLMAVGFADSEEELEKFATAIRGISIAMGQTQDFVTQNLILELFTQRGMRLDQLGLQYDKVKARADELAAADRNLTDQMAYQQAVLEQATERFGGLADSAIGAATGMEKASKAWTDLNLKFGQASKAPLDLAGSGIATWLKGIGHMLDAESAKLTAYMLLWQQLLFLTGASTFSPRAANLAGLGAGRDASRHGLTGATPGRGAPRIDEEKTAAIVDWPKGVADIERNAANDRLDAAKQFEQQRSSTIRDYNQTIAREAQDFATQRARAEADLADSIADIHADAARREIDQAEELARQIGQARADSAERLADMQADLDRTLAQRRADSADKIGEWAADRDEAITERRKDALDRLLEIEQDYAEQRQRAERDHSDRLSDAAASLDANAVYEEQRRFAREAEDALAARDEQLTDEKDKLGEAIDQLNEAHAERIADEKKALDKSIGQAQEAHNRAVADEKEALGKRIAQANAAHAQQLTDARAADALRIEDMKADFAERIEQEDADRVIRLGRLATDHNDQLTEMGRAHRERINQIDSHAAEELAEHNTAFDERMLELGVHNAALEAEQKRHEAESLKMYEEYLLAQKKLLETTFGSIPTPGTTPDSPRRQMLESEVALLRQEASREVINSPRHTELIRQLIALEEMLRNLGATAGVSGAGIGIAGMGASAFNYPIPPVAAASMTGTGGGGNVSIGDISFAVYGVPTDTAQELYNIIDQRLLTRIRQAARGL